MDREELRAKCWSLYRRYYPPTKGLEVICARCEEPITSGYDLHEWLIKRNSVKPEQQNLIMVPENCIPLHPQCHMNGGHTREVKEKCLWHAAGHLTAQRIGEWYVGLWQEHGLSVPHGLLVAARELQVYKGRELYSLGCKLAGEEIDESELLIQVENVPSFDARDAAFAIWTKRLKTSSPPAQEIERWYSLDRLIDRLSEGYWLHYLLPLCQ